MIELDLRGLNCPEPVIMLKNAMDSGAKDIKVLVSYGASASNVERLIKNSAYEISSEIKNENEIIWQINA